MGTHQIFHEPDGDIVRGRETTVWMLELLAHSHQSTVLDLRSEDLIRPEIREALDGWADGSKPSPGGFVRAVLENDLVGAANRADAYNVLTLGAIVMYCTTNLPGNSWGSSARVKAYQGELAAHRAAMVIHPQQLPPSVDRQRRRR